MVRSQLRGEGITTRGHYTDPTQVRVLPNDFGTTLVAIKSVQNPHPGEKNEDTNLSGESLIPALVWPPFVIRPWGALFRQGGRSRSPEQ